MEACTLALYQKNIFRVTGLSVDATSKEISRQVQRLQMIKDSGLGRVNGPRPAFGLAVPPTTDEIRAALARMREPEHRIIDEFFWYWPEEFGASREDPAIQALLAGDSECASRLWAYREKCGSDVARHNLAVMFHMNAVDCTGYHTISKLDRMVEEQIQEYWLNSFERWEKLIESDQLWNILIKRVVFLNDQALTTGFIRRMRRMLPQALDRINAEAALKFGEQGRLDWAKTHVNFLRREHHGLDEMDGTIELILSPSRKRLEQQLRSANNQSKKNPTQGALVASQIILSSELLMAVYDVFYSRDDAQRVELFDQVAVTVTNLLIAYQHESGDNPLFVELLKKTLQFSSSQPTQERLLNNIAIGKNNIAQSLLAKAQTSLNNIKSASINPFIKLKRIQDEIEVLIPPLAANVEQNSNAYSALLNDISITLRALSDELCTSAGDIETALLALRMAARMAVDPLLKRLIEKDQDDFEQIQRELIEENLAEKLYGNCHINVGMDEYELTQEFIRYNATKISLDSITRIRFGINKTLRINYDVEVTNKVHRIHFKRKLFCQSNAQALQNYKELVASLEHKIIPNLVIRLAHDVKSGRRGIKIGPLLLRSEAVTCETGELIWKQQHYISYDDLVVTNFEEEVRASDRTNTRINFKIDKRLIWNAAILDDLVNSIKNLR